MKEWKIYLVPHTHWDKEWYFIKETSDAYLVDNVKNIIEANEDNQGEAPFVYDGQYSIIDDFLLYYPQKINDVKKIMKNKKLVVGPWYTQTDMFNATGESIVRNLLIGTKLSEKMGHSMRVAYLPDTFGFNSNLPQIAKKAGCPGIIQWRGIDDKFINNSLLNMWEAEDGTKLLTYSLYKHGYFTGVGGLLGQYREEWSKNKDGFYWDPKSLAEKNAKFYLKFIADELVFLKSKAAYTNKRILIPVGSDQMPMVRGWNEVATKMNELDSENEWIVSTYDDFFNDLLSDKTVTKNVKTIKGEMRYGKYARSHKTINSSRYDIKSMSKLVEYKMYYVVEPLSVMFKKLGGEYPSEILLEVTKRLVSCHAHDSLGGCNTDETNRSILNRLEAAYALLESQETLMKKRIVDSIGMKANDLVLFNLMPYKRTNEFNLKINSKSKSFSVAKDGKKIDFSLIDQTYYDNKNFSIQEHSHFSLADREDKSFVFIDGEGPVNATNMVTDNDADGRYVTDIRLSMDCPAQSYIVLQIIEDDNTDNFNLSYFHNGVIKNEKYEISVDNSGAIKLLKSGKVYNNAWTLEAMFDAGDTYDYSPSRINDKPVNTFVKCKFNAEDNNECKILHIMYSYLVPECLDSEVLITQDIFMDIILYKTSIDIEIKIENVCKDIRWRLVAETNIKNSKYSYVDQSFAIVKHLVHDDRMNEWEKDKWVDMPVEIESAESIVYLKDDNSCYPIYVKGTNEYQITGKNDSKISLTLFRGVSFIGRRHLIYRPGRASGIDGYPHATPESNLNKVLKFKVRIDLYEKENMLNRSSKEWCHEDCYYQKQNINPFQWKGDTFVMTQHPLPIANKKITCDDLGDIGPLVVSAFKQVFDGNSNIVRLYNPSTYEYTLQTNVIHCEANLQDEPINKKLDLTLKPNEIKSYFIKD